MVSVLRKECAARNMMAPQSLSELELLALLKKDDAKRFTEKERRQKYKTNSSSRKKPIEVTAQNYVEKVCGGDIDKARPEWVKGRNDKVKLMRPAIKIVKGKTKKPRWILVKKK